MTEEEPVLAKHPLCELFQISLQEIAERKRFIGFTDEDEANVEAIHALIYPRVDEIVDAFYAHLRGFPELEAHLSDPKLLARLRETQRDYLLTLGRNSDRLAYYETRLQIAVRHERAGIRQKWYIGAYAALFLLILDVLASQLRAEPGRLAALVGTLEKVQALDVGLSVETYYSETKRRLEDNLSNLAEAQENLKELSRLDGLTGVFNRRFMSESLEAEIHRSWRFTHPFSVMLYDIDQFKEVNDNYGHLFGDYVLTRVVQLARESIRPDDIIGRLGGDEFVVGLLETPSEHVQPIAERFRQKVAEHAFQNDGISAPVTVSVGVACLNPGVDSLRTLLKKADSAMYEAKWRGRNRVVISPQIH